MSAWQTVAVVSYALIAVGVVVPLARFLWRTCGDHDDNAILGECDAEWTRGYSLFLGIAGCLVWPFVALGFGVGWAVPRIVNRAVPDNPTSRAEEKK